MYRKFILLLILVLLPVQVWGATYTVCTSGCDETTIQAVFDNNDLAPGDIVEVRADTPGGSKTYREQITWGTNDGGDSSNQVTLQGHSGDTIIISAADVLTGWTFGAGSELINNGGVEGSYSSGVAPNWVFTGGTGTPSEETSDQYAGTSSQKLTNSNEAANNDFRSETFSITLNKTYQIQVAVKIVSGENLTKIYVWDGDSMEDLETDISDATWTLKSYNWTATKTDANARIFLFREFYNDGVFMFDNVSVRELSTSIYQKTGITTEPKIVLYNGTRLTENNGNYATLGSDEWDWDSNVLYVNVGEDPDDGTLEASQRNYGIYARGVSYITVENLTTESANKRGVLFEISIGDSSDIQQCNVDGVTSRYNKIVGISHRSSPSISYDVKSSTVSNSTSTDNGGNGFGCSGRCTDITYDSNLADGNGWSIGSHGFSIGETEYELDTWTQHDGNIYKMNVNLDYTYTISSVVHRTDFIILTHNDGNYASLSEDEWDQEGDWVYVNIGKDPTGDTLRGEKAMCNGIIWTNNKAINQINTGGGSEGHGISADGFSTNTIISNNKSYDNAGDGITVNMGINPLISYNIVYGNYRGIRTQPGTTGAKIYNNTAYDNTEDGIHISDYSINVTIKNNITDSNGDDGIDIQPNSSGLSHNNNLSFGNIGDNWEGVSKQTNDVESDPLFTDAANGDFTLTSSSPCINAAPSLGSEYENALDPDSTWPNNVLTLSQDLY